jgi:glycosyltransferase involved in cell wall biosynthesis
MSDARKLTVIVPCYNERHTLQALLERVLAAHSAGLAKEVIVVDDGSTDGSAEVLRGMAAAHSEVRPVYHERNRGKGAAIQSAQAVCTGDVVLIQDADLEYDPGCYEELLAPILGGLADVVYGSRFGGGRPRRVLLFWHELGNRFLTTLSNVTTNLNLTDMETCYKAFRGDYFRGIPIRSRRFGFEPEVTAKVARLGLRVYEVPIPYHGRSYLAGKKVGWKDGFAALWTIFRYWLFPGLAGIPEGLETLLALRSAPSYNRWLFRRLSSYLGDRVLEAGDGIGNITPFLLNRERVVVVDTDPRYVETLREAFADNPTVQVEQFDFAKAHAYDVVAGAHLDTVLCVNVLEHLESDLEVLRAFHRILEPDGRVVLLVPHGRWLFGSLDSALGHVRRYTKQEVAEKMREAGFEVERVSTVNRAATLGWFLNGRVLKRKSLPWGQVRLFDLAFRLVRWVDAFLPIPGLSVVAIGRKAS